MAQIEQLSSAPIHDDPTEFRDDGAYVFHHPPKFAWEREPERPAQQWGRYSIYLHVPFCKKICTFCTFERKRLRRGSIDEFAAALWLEMKKVSSYDDFSNASIHSVYIGGGTGSLMSNKDILRFLDTLRDDFGLSGAVETTLECEPNTKTERDYEQIAAAGVNRISIGIQAFQDELLRRLNRSHNAAQAIAQVRAARRAGFENVHIDLMYGLPGQSLDMWRETLERALSLDVAHISIYPLIVFENELLSRQLHAGEAPPRPGRSERELMRQLCRELLTEAGYRRYSLTEYGKSGYECEYVITTWDGSDYLGFGPAAYSRSGNWLWENDLIHASYHRKIEQNGLPVGKGIAMSPEERLRRDVAMGLCMLEIDAAGLERRSGALIDEVLSSERDGLVGDGLIDASKERWVLTERGIRYATEVMKRLTADQEARTPSAPRASLSDNPTNEERR
jgi:oxygen-independent coproporphyrinogen III oxidase